MTAHRRAQMRAALVERQATEATRLGLTGYLAILAAAVASYVASYLQPGVWFAGWLP